MGVIEDSRKVMQDFLAPELRAIAVRLDLLEKRLDGVDKRFDGMESKMDSRFDDVERRADKRHNEMLAMVSSSMANEIVMLRERIAKLESRDSPHQ